MMLFLYLLLVQSVRRPNRRQKSHDRQKALQRSDDTILFRRTVFVCDLCPALSNSFTAERPEIRMIITLGKQEGGPK